jgi:tRNA(Arg) A34 adenosine deaminase TadA
VPLDHEHIDLVLAVEGCQTCCADLSSFEGKQIYFIARIEDAGKFLQKILKV